ncbi:hypothetical protein ACQY0O_001776 [Thecaphora frezii]
MGFHLADFRVMQLLEDAMAEQANDLEQPLATHHPAAAGSSHVALASNAISERMDRFVAQKDYQLNTLFGRNYKGKAQNQHETYGNTKVTEADKFQCAAIEALLRERFSAKRAGPNAFAFSQPPLSESIVSKMIKKIRLWRGGQESVLNNPKNGAWILEKDNGGFMFDVGDYRIRAMGQWQNDKRKKYFIGAIQLDNKASMLYIGQVTVSAKLVNDAKQEQNDLLSTTPM